MAHTLGCRSERPAARDRGGVEASFGAMGPPWLGWVHPGRPKVANCACHPSGRWCVAQLCGDWHQAQSKGASWQAPPEKEHPAVTEVAFGGARAFAPYIRNNSSLICHISTPKHNHLISTHPSFATLLLTPVSLSATGRPGPGRARARQFHQRPERGPLGRRTRPRAKGGEPAARRHNRPDSLPPEYETAARHEQDGAPAAPRYM